MVVDTPLPPDPVDVKRLGVLLSSYFTYHLPPRNYPKLLRDEHALHIIVNRLDSENEGATLEAVRLLLKLGTNVRIRDRNGRTVFYCLLIRLTPENQKATFALLVELARHGLDPSELSHLGESPLHLIVNRLDSVNEDTTVAAVRFFLRLGTDVNWQDPTRDGRTALHCLLRRLTPDNQKATLALVDILLEHGSDPEEKDYKERSSLQYVFDMLLGGYDDDQGTMLALVTKLMRHAANPLAKTEFEKKRYATREGRSRRGSLQCGRSSRTGQQSVGVCSFIR